MQDDRDPRRDAEPEDAPVDGPAPGAENQEDEGDLGSSSQDRPGTG